MLVLSACGGGDSVNSGFDNASIEQDAKLISDLKCLSEQIQSEIKQWTSDIDNEQAKLRTEQDAKATMESVGGKYDGNYNFGAYDSLVKQNRPKIIESKVELEAVKSEIDALEKQLKEKYATHPIEEKNLNVASESYMKNCAAFTTEQRSSRRSKLDFETAKKEYQKKVEEGEKLNKQ